MGQAKRYLLLVGLSLAVGVSGCGGQSRNAGPNAADTRFDENKALFGAIRDAGRLILYEGVPRERDGPPSGAAETVTLHGYPFYARPLEVTASDVAELKLLLADEGSFEQWVGEKACGGFHPDYLAEWRVGEVTYRFLVCMSCHEVKVYGPDRSLRCDTRGEAYKQLGELFKRQHNRHANRFP